MKQPMNQKKYLSKLRAFLPLGVGLGVVFLLGLPVLSWWMRNSAPASDVSQVGMGQPAGAPPVGGPFTLTDDQGRTVTEKSLVGKKYHMIFFGFTHCPDICPGMLQLMAGIEEKLPDEAREKLQFVFISVDPNRDTLKKLGTYVREFSPRFVGWTGTKAQIDAMVKNYLTYYAIQAAPKGEDPSHYTVNHSGFAYLMGPDGKYVLHVRSSDSATKIQAALERALR